VVVCSAIEHDAVLETCRAAAAGRTAAPAVELRLAPVDALGVLDLDALAGLLDERVALISVMAANNEVGAIQPLGAVAALARELSPEALLHTDAVQAAAFFDLAPLLEGYDLVTVSAHKLGARRARVPSWRVASPRPAGLWGRPGAGAPQRDPGRGRRRRHGRGDGRRARQPAERGLACRAPA